MPNFIHVRVVIYVTSVQVWFLALDMDGHLDISLDLKVVIFTNCVLLVHGTFQSLGYKC